MPAAITLDAVILSASNTKRDQEISKEPEGGKGVSGLNGGPSNHLSPADMMGDTHANILKVVSSFCPLFPSPGIPTNSLDSNWVCAWGRSQKIKTQREAHSGGQFHVASPPCFWKSELLDEQRACGLSGLQTWSRLQGWDTRWCFLNHRGSTVITIDLITLDVSKTSILQADSEVWRREERGREEKQAVPWE